MAKKIKIDVDFNEDYTLIAVSCQKKDHWIALQLNKTLKTDLRRITDVGFYHWKKKEIMAFPVWYYADTDKTLGYYLISNSHPEAKLIPSLNTTDYFLLINGILTDEAIHTLISSVRKIAGVLLVKALDHEKVKDIDNLIADLELHMIEYLKA